MIKRLPRLGALAARRPLPRSAPAQLHTSAAARNPDGPRPTQNYKATIVEDDDDDFAAPKKPSSKSSKSSTSSSTSSSTKKKPIHPFFEDDHDESTGSASRPTVLSRLEHAAEDIHSAEQRGQRLRAEAEILDADATMSAQPIALPPRRSWASATDKIAEEDEDYEPATDYAKIPAVGGLDGWFDSKERWGRKVRPDGKDFFPPSVDAKKQRKFMWNEVVKVAVTEAVGAREGIERKMEVERKLGQGPWMEEFVLDDLMLKFDICKRVFGMTGFKVPDAKLHSINTLYDLYTLMAGPPAPQTVYQAVRALVKPGHRAGVPAANTEAKEVRANKPRVMTKGPALLRLPNVRVLPRPLTMVQREREVGRWKEIQREWQRRGLPVGNNLSRIESGTEKAWAFGKT